MQQFNREKEYLDICVNLTLLATNRKYGTIESAVMELSSISATQVA